MSRRFGICVAKGGRGYLRFFFILGLSSDAKKHSTYLMIYSWTILYSHRAMRKVFYFVLFQDDMNMNNFKVMINKIGQCLL